MESVTPARADPSAMRRYGGLGLAAAAGLATTFLCLAGDGMPREAAFMAGIFVLAALLWATEALPLFATALLVLGLQVVLLANPGGWPGLGFGTGPSPDYRTVLGLAMDPVLLLFFGGFLMAQAAVKTGVDRAMSALLLRPFGPGPLPLLAGVMGVTALFSMFMSNTATTAMMLALVAPLLVGLPPAEPYRRALLLGVAFAANLGGMGTPIGSPPNAVAVGRLREAGVTVHFLDWMLVAVPLMVLCLGLALAVLWGLFRPRSGALPRRPAAAPIGRRGWFVVAVFTLTVLLWLTDRWHGMPAAVIALLPAIAYTASRTLDAADLRSLDWSVLILIGGGIALGAGMSLTGLDRSIAGWLPLAGGSIAWVAAVLALATLALSTFMSNTAAANLLLPLGLSVAAGLGGPGVLREIAMTIALTAALAMALPISTPPNAMAYGRGGISTAALARAGLLVGLAGAALVLLGTGVLLRFWGLDG